MMGRSLNGTDAYSLGLDFELPEHPTNVSDFYLDTFEVTVARFRPFVLGYPDTLPKEGEGAHPKKPGTGWQSAWIAAFAALPATRAKLETQLTCPGENPGIVEPTYAAEPGPNDALPINCVNWYEAFAFCVWEGGRLSTEAEWEYAAAGGAENRLYPWGAEPPDWPFFKRSCLHSSCIGKYGTVAGASRWGNFDLAGSLMEIVLDTPAAYSPDECTDCIVYDPTKFGKDSQVITARGGAFISSESEQRAAWRGSGLPWMWSVGSGFRCARSP